MARHPMYNPVPCIDGLDDALTLAGDLHVDKSCDDEPCDCLFVFGYGIELRSPEEIEMAEEVVSAMRILAKRVESYNVEVTGVRSNDSENAPVVGTPIKAAEIALKTICTIKRASAADVLRLMRDGTPILTSEVALDTTNLPLPL